MMVDAATIIVPLAASIIGGLIVAFANHWLTSSRERNKRLAELTIQRRIEAYKKLERASQTGREFELEPTIRDKMLDDFEAAYAETMLLGNKREIELAQIMGVQLSTNKASDGLIPLLDEIRNNLRRELRLEKTELGNNRFLRMHRHKD